MPSEHKAKFEITNLRNHLLAQTSPLKTSEVDELTGKIQKLLSSAGASDIGITEIKEIIDAIDDNIKHKEDTLAMGNFVKLSNALIKYLNIPTVCG